MQHARRQLVDRRVGRGEAEHVGAAHRLGAQAGAHDVANHAAEARVGAAVGLEGRGVVVRLDLERDVELVVEPHDAGVVLEDADAPVVVAPAAAQLLRGGEDRLLEHVLELPLAALVAVGDPAGERLVAAVLAPGLGDRFQLDVGRLAAQLGEMPLDRLHLGELQVELPLAAEPHEGVVVEAAIGDGAELEAVVAARFEPRERQRPDDDLLDGVVGEHLVADCGCRRRRPPAPAIQYLRSVRTASIATARSRGRPLRRFGPPGP